MFQREILGHLDIRFTREKDLSYSWGKVKDKSGPATTKASIRSPTGLKSEASFDARPVISGLSSAFDDLA